MKHFFPLLLSFAVISCTTLPNPSKISGSPTNPQAAAVLKKSALAHGDPWKRLGTVELSFDGEWSPLACKIQPVITDPEFRKSSVETYRPGLKQLTQLHRGPGGSKMVKRTGNSIIISYNGAPTKDAEQLDAAALVADAYTIFVFGSSWLSENAENLQLLPSRKLDGESCDLVSGTLKPGLGRSGEDQFIAWISKDTGFLKRFQFTLNGLESTRGADVEVTFFDFKSMPGGTTWPTHFIERIKRPLNIKAHEWRMTSLSLDGRRVLQ
jgi:hypothetical protein